MVQLLFSILRVDSVACKLNSINTEISDRPRVQCLFLGIES